MSTKARILLIVFFLGSLAAGIILLLWQTGKSAGDRNAISFSMYKHVGLIRLEGVIEDAEWISGELKEMRDNPSIASVVLRIESPGGGVAASQEIYEEVKRFRASGKNLVVSMGNVAASGGYYVACPAKMIFANPGTITGSIGVLFQTLYAEELFKKIGVGQETVKSGDLKDVGSPSKRLTEAERRMLQEVVDDSYGQFLDAILEARPISREDLLKIADGRILTGRQARNKKLIDTLGTLQDAIACAATLGGIRGEPKIAEPKPYRSFNWRDYVFGSLSQILLGRSETNGSTAFLRYQMK